MTAVVFFYSRHHRTCMETLEMIQATSHSKNIVTCVRADDLHTRRRLISVGVTTLPVIFVTQNGDVATYEKDKCFEYLEDLAKTIINVNKYVKSVTEPPPTQQPPQPPQRVQQAPSSSKKSQPNLPSEEEEFATYMSTSKVKTSDAVSRAKAERGLDDNMNKPAVNPTHIQITPEKKEGVTSMAEISSDEVSSAPFSLEIIEESPKEDEDDVGGMDLSGDLQSRISQLKQGRN